MDMRALVEDHENRPPVYSVSDIRSDKACMHFHTPISRQHFRLAARPIQAARVRDTLEGFCPRPGYKRGVVVCSYSRTSLQIAEHLL